ncbi:unnamed protein product [Toxocara canis]|uniref:MICOS complex subunit MIC60 n=1 Tax=Toxocara canis TaxID=6265 RepID=A0A3P7F623_TOXCA|nr:unnamed protein product [Toxocara canis]
MDGMEVALANRSKMVIANKREKHWLKQNAHPKHFGSLRPPYLNVMDSLNRRTKHCWLACQNLVNSVVNGRCEEDDIELRRLPLATQLSVIKESSGNDVFVQAMISALPNESIAEGTYTDADLKRRFSKVFRANFLFI